VSLYPCSACGNRVPGKLSQIYWAWNQADGHRVAYKQRLCLNDFTATVYPVLVKGMADMVSCPACGISTINDMDPVYATIYTPGQPQIDAEWAMCPACAVEVRNHAIEGSERLPDRQDGVGGSSPPPVTAADAWRALGLAPNGRGPEYPDD